MKGALAMRTTSCCLFAAHLLFASSIVVAEPLPAPAQASGKIIHSLEYTDAAEARQAWKPVYGSVPVTVAPAGDRHVLKLPCIFKGNRLERGTWEWSVDLDLTACRGIELQIYCADLEPISGFTLYFQTGQGWYGLNFNPEYAGRWCRVVLDKSKAIPEGTPAGWGKIRTIRFSAWRGYDTDTHVYLANLAMAGGDAPIVVVRPASPNPTATTVTETLQRYDLPYLAVNENELTRELVQGRQLLVLPGNAGLKASAVETVEAFVQSGGKLAVFGTAPERIAALAHAKFDRLPDSAATSQDVQVLSALAQAWPPLWDEAVRRALARAGEIAGFASVEAAVEAIRQAANADAGREAIVHARIEDAASLRTKAADLHAAGRHADAVTAAEQARAALIDAMCLAQSSLEGEHRAFWCHEAYGVRGMPWDESIRILAENGFTAILPNMLWAGVAYYESDVLPVSPEVATRGNLLTECLAACKKYGIECHVWKVNFYMSGRSPQEFRDRMKREGRTLKSLSGQGKDDWLCPSHPENRKLEVDSMVELATRYPVDGIHFDYIRYPGDNSCICDGCRERFERAIGHKVADWPNAVRQDPAIRDQWYEWRRGNITAVVAGVAEQVRRRKPDVKISAAVFSAWSVARDTVGQDWKLWCEKGYLDFVCPMNYTPNVAQFRAMTRHQQEWAGNVPCYPGIGLSVWPERNDICRIIEQINVTRQLKTGGFTVFNYAEPEARVILPMLGKGITKE